MPPRKQDPPAAPEPDDVLKLDTRSFVASERLEVQKRFDTAFGDLVQYIRDYVTGGREGPLQTAIIDRDKTRWFPDQIMAYMLWVEARRTDPTARLEDYDAVPEVELRSAAVRGFLGKGGTPSTKPTPSSNGPGSSASTGVGSPGPSLSGSRGPHTSS